MNDDLNTRFRLRDKEIANNNKRIEKLEDKVESLKDVEQSRDNIKEVLRELKPILLHHFENDKIEGRLALQDLFKKLDGKTEESSFEQILKKSSRE